MVGRRISTAATLSALLAACSPVSEGEIRARPGEHTIYVIPAAARATADMILTRARACFEGRKINFRPTLVHKEPAGDGFLITIYQLGTYDPSIFTQVDVLPDPAGTRVEVLNSGSFAMPNRMGPVVKAWIDGKSDCPPVLF